MKKLTNLTKTQKSNALTYLVVCVAFVIMFALQKTGGLSSKMSGMLVPICAYIAMALSLNLTVGIIGELSLGHAGFMSVGAFVGTTAILIMQFNGVESPVVRLVVGIIIAAIATALVGFLIGIPVLRLKGDYLAIVTLAFAEIIKSLFQNMYLGIDENGLQFSMVDNTVNLSENGRIIIEGAMGIRSITKISNFFIGFLLVIVCLTVIFNLVSSRSGRAIMAIRDNRIAAESVGIPIFKYKIIGFTISAAMAGAAGCLFAQNYSSCVASKFNIDCSILILVFVVLGKQGNMLGSIIAAAALTILPEVLRSFADYRMLLYAIILIVVMLAGNNAKFKAFFNEKVFGKIKKSKKEVIANE
ncbi:MAG: branched-chain amino acid ABC transporter permease [Bacillota bacterium]|nr:branched-chain amino acid ABC transporter permease [Bacillota bacterium]